MTTFQMDKIEWVYMNVIMTFVFVSSFSMFHVGYTTGRIQSLHILYRMRASASLYSLRRITNTSTVANDKVIMAISMWVT